MDIKSDDGGSPQGEIPSKYNDLVERSPYTIKETGCVPHPSFPDWELTDEQKMWADEYLKLGSETEVIANFAKSLEKVGSTGLQLLRQQAVENGRTAEANIVADLSMENLSIFLRNTYQADALFYEEGLRHARDFEDSYWHGEDGQLNVAHNYLMLSREALIDTVQFNKNSKGDLSGVKKFILSEIRSMESAASHNEAFAREYFQGESLEHALDGDNKELAFLNNLQMFVENESLKI